jgi:hypothetical protein
MEQPTGSRDVEEILDAVEAAWVDSQAAQCEIFLAAARYADVCSGEDLPDGSSGSRRALPGTERRVRLGGVGTPGVAEFAAAEFGARLRMGPVGGRSLIADALDVRFRLPNCYGRVVAGEARVPWVRLVAARTRHLSVAAAEQVDLAMADCVDGRIPWSRFEARLEGVVVAADPEAAAARERERREQQYARSGQSSDAGMKSFWLRAPTALVVGFDATVGYLADALHALGDTDDQDRRRVKACAILANPTQAVELLSAFAQHRSQQHDDPLPEEPDPDEPDPDEPDPDEPDPDEPSDVVVPRRFRPDRLPDWLARAADPTRGWRLWWPRLLPRANLYLHLAGETVDRDAGGVARWEGEGPVTLQYVRERIAAYHDIRVTPVVDLAKQAPVDAYEIPDRHRSAVRLRTPADCFPFSANLTDQVDLDHTDPYDHASAGSAGKGQTRPGNLGPLGRFNHRLKTHGAWQVKQPFEGIYVWRDPHGQIYLVDHTGTRKVSPPRSRAGPTAEPPEPLVIEIYRSPLRLIWAA